MRKKIVSAMLAITMAVGGLVGCGANSNEGGKKENVQSKARSLDEIKKDGTIKIGVFSDKNPFGYIDSNGKIQGYDVYFANRIGRDLLGSEDAIEFVYVEAASRVEYLQLSLIHI